MSGGGSVLDSDDASEADSATSSEDRRGPLADLAEGVAARRDRIDGGRFEEVIAEPGFDALREGSAWNAVGGDETPKSEDDGETVEAGVRTSVVSKRDFCEQCRYFSEPPEVRCVHEGTEIREFVDAERVRLYSCPIVEERGIGDDDLDA